MDIEAALEATKPEPTTRRDAPRFEYGWDGNAGYIQTGALTERPKTWDEFIRDSGLDPDEVEVIEPVQIRGWDTSARLEDGTTGLVRAHYYRLTVQRRTLKRDLDDLIRVAKRHKPTPPAATSGDSAFVLALGDLQLGKMDGDGLEGTVARYLAATTAAVKRYRRIAKGRPVYLIHLGDCIEGMVSQGGANQWRTTLTVTEQVRLYRCLLIEQVKAFASITDRLVVAGIPGNHDEANRPLHTYGDSWAIDALSAVKDALDLAGNYEHVSIHAPARDELTLTLDVAGTIVGLAHGHQWRAGQATTWWAKQAHGRQPVGDADLLLTGHLHHLHIEQTGSDKTWVQVPALESGSQWWKHRTGEWGQPGIVTAIVGGGSWRSLEIL
jgi:predicted phosphodiesterase